MESNDENEIVQATLDFQKAWNNGDAKAASEFFAENGVRVGAFGDIQIGKAEVEKAYEKLLNQTMPGASVKQERGTVRMLTDDLAIWQGGIELVPPGSDNSMKGHVVQVMKKENGKWLVLEAHPKFFPPASVK